MPWTVKKSDQCPTSKPWGVLGPDGKPAKGGCHATKPEALKHQKALTINAKSKAWYLGP